MDGAALPSNSSKHKVLLCTIPIGAKRYCMKCLPRGAAGKEFISSNSENRGFVYFTESSLNVRKSSNLGKRR